MIQGLIGKKIGMTQMFDDDGQVVPVTVIKAGPCLIVQKKIKEKDPWMKVQLGLVEDRKVKRVNKPLRGHFEKASVPPTRIMKEFLIDEDNVNIGDSVKVDIFQENEAVSVSGITKGKGFQGVVKRWNFAGGRATHGSMFHRRPGSTGMCAFPGKIIKGKKMPGQMGGKRKTVKGLQVVKVDVDKNLLVVKGAVPGFNGNYVYIHKDSFRT
ncbi:MAG: 50S ribosomal protein L3 [Candidatus Aminicenantes bacterium]|nr:50S ribosomal protein L3 [Candidatus Aminicenantes bacterium]NIM81525.1 50S ribosomal protein L3 [Candidatus Aminicenantes bacterium]NIN20896.1 50S ribosomal protein L3 [Candidatus Aminicenantes bacterium]NIN44717.1 50S ribosomal protein L3 [Candidatus Aminicenantes bacterium]NIN87525.1 50S ribosomal protein L3 [Candidatus Aminicenantes bacterium]